MTEAGGAEGVLPTKEVMLEIKVVRSWVCWSGALRAVLRSSTAEVPDSSCLIRLLRDAAPWARPWLGFRTAARSKARTAWLELVLPASLTSV